VIGGIALLVRRSDTADESEAGMTQGQNRLTLGRSRRMIRKGDFQRTFDGRCTAADSRLVLYVLLNGLDHARIGLAVGSRHGNAVQRNRLRRLLREAFRLEQHNLPSGFDYLFVPRPAPQANLATYRQSLLRLSAQAVRRWHSRPPQSG
jgi:ribonuclease P protein component